MKFGTTQTYLIVSGSNKKIASRRLGSSFQNAHSTSAKIFRRRISAACASVGALESGFTVEPCATINNPVSALPFTSEFYHRRHGGHRETRAACKPLNDKAADIRAVPFSFQFSPWPLGSLWLN